MAYISIFGRLSSKVDHGLQNEIVDGWVTSFYRVHGVNLSQCRGFCCNFATA